MLRSSKACLLLVFVLGCGFHPGGSLSGDDGDVDALPPNLNSTFDPTGAAVDEPIDAGLDASPDAPPGLPLDAPCTPALVVEECAAGLTCRYIGNDMGRCRPVGTQPVGGFCATADACGAGMYCLSDGGSQSCFRLCRQQNQCQPQQVCGHYWGGDQHTSLCTPN